MTINKGCVSKSTWRHGWTLDPSNEIFDYFMEKRVWVGGRSGGNLSFRRWKIGILGVSIIIQQISSTSPMLQMQNKQQKGIYKK